ncbi:MAG: hypothetical protein RL141_307 [Candidatus Parcubacteria bacterium]
MGDAGAAGSAGTGGAGGSAGEGEAGAGGVCAYTPPSGTIDISTLNLNNNVLIPVPPVFRPIDVGGPDEGPCTTAGEMVTPGSLFEAQNDVAEEIFAFEEPLATQFYGFPYPFGYKAKINDEEAIISGLGMRAETCEGNRTYVISNATGDMLEIAPGGATRVVSSGYPALSGITCFQGDLYLTTPREWTPEGWNQQTGAKQPLTVEHQAQPIRVIKYSRLPSDTFEVITTIDGGSHVASQGWWLTPAGNLIQTGYMDILKGRANDLYLGDFLFGQVIRIPIGDPLSPEQVFQTDPGVGFTGMDVTPTGIVYITVMGTSPISSNCSVFQHAKIQYWNENTSLLVDFLELGGAESEAALPTLCRSGIVFYRYNQDVLWVGGNFDTLVADDVSSFFLLMRSFIGRMSWIDVE